MSIVLRPYQQEKLAEVDHAFSKTRDVVLAACPGAGKTVMAMDFIEREVRSGREVLVLTHSTNVIKDQWVERFQDFVLQELLQGSEVEITLPQNLHKLNKTYKTIIIDEAHHNVLGEGRKESQSVIANTLKTMKPDKVLYLTGTPSKFNAANLKAKNTNKPQPFEMIFLPMSDIREEYLSDVNFEMVRSSYSLDIVEDYTKNDEVKGSVRFKNKD